MRHAWLVAIAAAYLYVFPYFPAINSANELPRVFLVKAMVEERELYLDTSVAKWGKGGDMSPGLGDHIYSNKAPGSSLIVLPVYAAVHLVGTPSLGGAVWICRFVAGIAPMLAFLALLSSFLTRVAPELATRRLVLVAYGLGSMAMTYSLLYYSHQLSAICIASAWILAVDYLDGKRGLLAMALCGFLAGCAPLVDYQAAFCGVPIAGWLVYRVVRERWSDRWLGVVVAAVAAIPPLVVLLAYHKLCFGSPFATGYAASQVYAADHHEGLLGLTYPKWDAFVGSTFSFDNGLFTLAPWLLLVIPGTVTLWRRGQRGLAVVGAGNLVVMLGFVASIKFWRGGWEVGPRYVTAMLPFLLPAIAAQLDEWRRLPLATGAAGALMLVGISIYSLTHATFPYWPDSFHHPIYEVTFRLLGDNLVAPSLGSAVGITGIAGIAPYLLLVFGLAAFSVYKASNHLGLLLAVGGCLVILVAYGLVPHGGRGADSHYMKVRTVVAHPG